LVVTLRYQSVTPEFERTLRVRTEIKPDTRLLTPAEVAAMLRVDPKTVTRWARGGKLSSIRTPGGHRRYSESEVRGFLNGWQHVSLPRASGE
jgi:excisionase family DNA binding protein